MRLATVRVEGGTRAARLVGDRLVLLEAADVGELLASPDRERALEASTGEERRIGEADLAPVVVAPRKIFCAGLNYRAHLAEMGRDEVGYPTMFAKFGSSLLGPTDDLVLPSVSTKVDWEVELCVVMGSRLRRGQIEDARAAIFGYSVANDVSMRDWQMRTSQFLQGKTFDASTPVGPVVVTGDEIGDGEDLELRCEVDGEVMQQGRTSQLVFSPATLVSYVSQFSTLEPGDLVLTGTPGGVGAGRRPPVFLKPGQVLTTTVEQIGSCTNRCVAEQ